MSIVRCRPPPNLTDDASLPFRPSQGPRRAPRVRRGSAAAPFGGYGGTSGGSRFHAPALSLPSPARRKAPGERWVGHLPTRLCPPRQPHASSPPAKPRGRGMRRGPAGRGRRSSGVRRGSAAAPFGGYGGTNGGSHFHAPALSLPSPARRRAPGERWWGVAGVEDAEADAVAVGQDL